MTAEQFNVADRLLSSVQVLISNEITAHHRRVPGDYGDAFVRHAWVDHMRTLTTSYSNVVERRLTLANRFTAEAFGEVDWRNVIDEEGDEDGDNVD